MSHATRPDNDGLDDFEKQLAADKAERDREQERQERRHKHHHRSERHDRDGERHRHGKHNRRDDDDGHRSKRSRTSRNDEDRHDGKQKRRHGGGRSSHEKGGDEPDYIKSTDPNDKLPLPDEQVPEKGNALVRDDWMTTPSAIEIDYVQRKRPDKTSGTKFQHSEEAQTVVMDQTIDPTPTEAPEVTYTFGDSGSQWRMTKLKAVYTLAEQEKRSVDDVAEDRFGSLKEFDDAREERIELDRRKLYGEGYVGSEKPTGDLYRERQAKTRPPPRAEISPELDDEPEQGAVVPDAPILDQSALNKMRAQVMKAKIRNAPNLAQLETEYDAALARFNGTATADQAVVLDAMHSRMLAGQRGEVQAVETTRGRERGLVEEKQDMSIEDMVREERRTRGQAGGEGLRLAERIAKDGKFDDDLEYLNDNAEKLAKRVHKTEASLKTMAVEDYKKMTKVLDKCPLCHHEDRPPPQDRPIAPILSLGTRVFLTLATEPELQGAEGGAVIVPTSHRTNLLECDDDEWEEIRNFMKSLTRLYHEQGREVVFYENAAAPHRRLHAAMVAVPIPYDLGDTAPAFFREAILSSDEEWSQHKKLIDTAKRAREGLGKSAFRKSIAKEMPYFHAWFGLDGGLGHVVEDESRWPKGDLFAREILGGMLDAGPDNIKKQGRWNRADDARVEEFRKRWRKFDWTRVLTDG